MAASNTISSKPIQLKAGQQLVVNSKTTTTTNNNNQLRTKREKNGSVRAAISPEDEAKLRAKQERIMWRDFVFLMVALVLASIMSFVELNSADVELRGGTVEDASQGGIVDTGFILTKPLHSYLEENRNVNDWLAGINTIIGVIGPGIYMVYQTFWVGDYDVVFRYLTISAVRSLCGWVTYLPPDQSYLVSHYDFPDIAQCLLKDCGDPRHATVQPFVSFFSGHVATLVINANHMYLHGFRDLGLFFHFFNIFQIIRLLATRGHYSIDIVIGWYMAVYVSNPAGRLGRHFSRGDKSFTELFVPVSSEAAFERMTGVEFIREERRLSKIIKNPEAFDAITDEDEVLPEPTARMAYEGKILELNEALSDLSNSSNAKKKN